MLDRTFAVQEKLLIPRTWALQFLEDYHTYYILIWYRNSNSFSINAKSSTLRFPFKQKTQLSSMSYHLTILLGVFFGTAIRSDVCVSRLLDIVTYSFPSMQLQHYKSCNQPLIYARCSICMTHDFLTCLLLRLAKHKYIFNLMTLSNIIYIIMVTTPFDLVGIPVRIGPQYPWFSD